MVASPQQCSIIRHLHAAMEGLGYTGELLCTRYPFGDWFSQESPTLTADLAAFGQTPVSYSTACIGVAASNGLSGMDIVRAYRSLGAPILLEVQDELVVPWRVGVKPTGTDRLEPFSPQQIDTVFQTHRDVWSPRSILRAKNIQPAGPRQMDFIDLGLLPALEEHIRLKLDPILRNGLATAIDEYNRGEPSRQADERQLFRAAFWMLAGKVFHDRQHEKFTNLSASSDPDEVLRRVGKYYGERISARLLNKEARLALHRAIWDAIDFRNLSVEVLAEVWANTLVTPELRKRLGIHSTPRSLAKYMVDRIPFEEISENERYVVEPCCGSARFLIAALQRLRLLLPSDTDVHARHDYFTRMLAGYETDPFGVEISRLGLMLADYPNPDSWELHCDDVFTSPSFEESLRKARVVLCNPPFEDFDEQTRKRYAVSTPRQPAALLSRVLEHIHPEGMLAFVLPRKFLDGKSYRPIRGELVSRFGQIEVLSLPDNAFEHAQADTAVLLATQPRRDGAQSSVTHRKVDSQDWMQFQVAHDVTRENSDAVDAEQARRSLAIPELTKIWKRLKRLPCLGTVAEIHRGIEWSLPISSKDENAKDKVKANRALLVRDEPANGYWKGVAPGTKFDVFVRPVLKFLSMREDHRRGNAAPRAWVSPKVIVNSTRRSRGKWRLAAFADPEGIVCYQTFTAVWPRRPDCLSILTAVLNGPVANAFVSSHEHGKHITRETLTALPVPDFDGATKRGIDNHIAHYLSALTEAKWEEAWVALLEIDSEVTQAYGLSDEEERLLLRYLSDSRRPVPKPLAKMVYSPPQVADGITFRELLSISRDWDDSNKRRCVLIDKRLASELTPTEEQDLNRLQYLADKRLQFYAPLRGEALDRILESLNA